MPGTYHSRRKSGQGLPTNTSMTDVRKAMGAEKRQRSSGSTSKRSKEQQPTTYKLGRSPKEREREYYEYADDGDGRDTFPQYCMACEKQFLPVDDRCLYCSEACREFDENSFRHAAPLAGRPAAVSTTNPRRPPRRLSTLPRATTANPKTSSPAPPLEADIYVFCLVARGARRRYGGDISSPVPDHPIRQPSVPYVDGRGCGLQPLALYA
ncbi:unnamed protein product [Parascedosporium putredinis]|uniref:Uncharacterized protein n=1 Tax=Parascedosporium putredinis TaxID=1442378 RepID=A0A9P1GX40_9PEZI|nr:unnamed protein product [Parascedosporium putredinis]CAI7988676.1 unnamed protein product [Parascedosporium putredinis]